MAVEHKPDTAILAEGMSGIVSGMPGSLKERTEWGQGRIITPLGYGYRVSGHIQPSRRLPIRRLIHA